MKLTTLFIFVIGAHAALSQTINPRAGFALSTTSDYLTNGSDKREIKFNGGYFAGLAFNISTGNTDLSFQPEILWIQKGQVTELEPTRLYSEPEQVYHTAASKDRYILNYLEMPVLVRWKPLQSFKNFFIEGGVSVSYALPGKRHHRFSVESPNLTFSEYYVYEVRYDEPPSGYAGTVYLQNRLDIGLQVGIGVLVFRQIWVEVRYGHGMTSYSGDIQGISFKNRAIQAGVSMPLFRKKSVPPGN